MLRAAGDTRSWDDLRNENERLLQRLSAYEDERGIPTDPLTPHTPPRQAGLDERLAEALEHIDGAFVTFDREWRFAFVNRKAVRPVGLEPSDVIGRNVWDMYPQMRDTAIARHYRRAMEDRVAVRFEDMSPVNRRWYEVSVYPIPEGIAAHWHDVTDRKVAEQALRESEERARVTAEAGLTGLFDWEPQTARMYWSDQNFRTLGLDPGSIEPSYQAWADRVHRDDLERVEGRLQVAQRERRPYHDVHRVVWPDGSVHIMEARAQFSFDEAGACTRICGTYVDITERAQAEQSLRESEARFRVMADDTPLSIWVTDAAGGIQFINRAFCEFFGATQEAAAALDWRSFVHPDDAAYVSAVFESLRTQTPFSAEARMRRADGAWRWIASHGVPRFSGSGTFLGFVGSSSDVTESKVLQERERTASVQAHFRSLFESVPGLYVVLTPDEHRIVAVSNAYLQATGTTRDTLLGRRLFDVFADDPANPAPESLSSLKASLSRVATEGCVDVIAVHRFPLRRPEALGGGFEERWWSPVSAPVFAPDGTVAYIIHRVEDVTPYVAATRDHLEGTADRRVEHMAAEVVMRAQELQRANERLRENARRLQTEIEERRRLETIRGQLIRQLVSAQEEERRRVARELHDSLGQHLAALGVTLASVARRTGVCPDIDEDVGRLQTLARTIDEEVDRLAAELRPAALDDLGLDDALHRHVRAWAEDTGVPTDIHTRGLDRRLPEAVETTVYRVVQEALTNVRKHARAGRASVVVEFRDGDLIAIVEDDGIGFQREDADAAGDPGRQLGLTTMRERAALVGGRIQIESTAGLGSTVFLRVPIGD